MLLGILMVINFCVMGVTFASYILAGEHSRNGKKAKANRCADVFVLAGITCFVLSIVLCVMTGGQEI